MDVTRILSELRAERAAINEAILSLERSDRVNTGTALAAVHSVTEIGSHVEHRGGSFRRRTCRGQARKRSF
jgi:hypothetical protein